MCEQTCNCSRGLLYINLTPFHTVRKFFHFPLKQQRGLVVLREAGCLVSSVIKWSAIWHKAQSWESNWFDEKEQDLVDMKMIHKIVAWYRQVKGAVKVPTHVIWTDQNTVLCVIHVRWTGQEVLFHGYRNTSRLHIDQANYHPVAVAVFQTNKIVQMFSRHMFLYFLNVYSLAIFSITFVLCVFLAAQSSQEG